METFLREWRQTALNKHQYDAAVFIGDKLLALTNDDKDAFWLAQVHFSTGNYARAQGFLSDDLIVRNTACKYLAGHCKIKQGRIDDALAILGEKNPQHLISLRGSTRRKLMHVDAPTRNGHGHGHVHSHNHAHANGKGTKGSKPTASAAGMSGMAPPRSERIDRSEERNWESASDIRYEAGMCYLRGLCYAKQNAFDKAKECYKDAVCIDVQCFEAFDQLMKNSLMSPDEEWKFLETLNFDMIAVAPDEKNTNTNTNTDNNKNNNNPSTTSTTTGISTSASQEAADFTKLLYTTRLCKYTNPTQFTAATDTLSTHYALATNADILLSKADLLFTQCRFTDALKLTSWILSRERYNFAALPVHLACLHELHETNALFLLAHDLADSHADEPASWLAVGVYYLTIGRVAEARRYFSKASMMDPHFGPAWIGFAHTFAAEGEHDQAISAYSTAARLFQGTHLPPLFLGMQNLQLNNVPLAREYLDAAHALCRTDPLLLNELGVVAYHDERLGDAIELFRHALALAEATGADPRVWLPTRANLGHACRRAGMYADALAAFEEALRLGGKSGGVFAAKGLALLEMGEAWAGVQAFHEALAVSPQDPVATELLGKALELVESGDGVGVGAEGYAGLGVAGMEEDTLIEGKLQEATREAARRLRYRRTGRRRGNGKVEGGGMGGTSVPATPAIHEDGDGDEDMVLDVG